MGRLALPQQAFFHVELRNFEPRVGGPIPVLTANVSVQVNGSGGGFGEVRIANPAAKRVVFEILHVESALAWVTDPRMSGGLLPSLSTGRLRTFRTTTLELNANYWVHLEFDFPIPPIVLSEIEEFRSGGDPKFLIDVRFAGLARYEFDQPTPGGVPFLSPFVAEDLRVVAHDSGSAILEIEKGRWIERVLPGLGFGRWMIYEVPAENFEGSAQVDVYLNNAVKQFLAGEYKLSIAASRDVVETLERELGANANPAFGDRFGSSDKKFRKVTDAFAELTQSMLAYQSALKSLLATGAHPERPDELVERPDAEMALWLALSLRRYVGMRLRSARPPSPSEGAGPGT